MLGRVVLIGSLHFGGKTVDVMVGNIGALRRENCGCSMVGNIGALRRENCGC